MNEKKLDKLNFKVREAIVKMGFKVEKKIEKNLIKSAKKGINKVRLNEIYENYIQFVSGQELEELLEKLNKRFKNKFIFTSKGFLFNLTIGIERVSENVH